MNRREFLAAATVGAVGVSIPRFAPAQVAPALPQRPNIVLILADDLGYGDVGCYGQQQFATPHIDKLAAEGIRFTSAYAGSTVCSPSRCALMTGLHTGHCSYRGNMGGEPGIPDSDVTIAEVLKSAGYRTGIFGKWGLGTVGRDGYPTKQGFDRFYGYLSQGQAHNYFPRHLMDNDVAARIGANVAYGDKKPSAYAPDLIQKQALAWLAEQKAGEPFFIYLPSTLPHANNEMGRDTGDGMEAPDEHPYKEKEWPRPMRGFAGMMHCLDQQVGEIVAQLKKQGLDRNTLVVFSSDNGPHREGGYQPEFFNSSGPLRGIKRDLTEGGIRVPFITWMPGLIRGGQVSEQPLAFWDLLPTFAALAGASAPAGLDGISIVDPLFGRGQITHPPMYWEFHEREFKQAIRDGDWKAIRVGLGGKVALYDLSNDLGETHEVSAQHPDIVRKMEALFVSMRTDSKMFPVKG
ncbi:MAG: arylsulfatase [Bryobacterales bacterium]|nr:arylsulfatase [Bryobacterales bacterium]